MPAPCYLYHWTTRRAAKRIARVGLDPDCTTGARRVVWACEESRILWAVSHVSRNHGISPDDLLLLCIRANPRRWKRTSFPAVWTCDSVVAPSRVKLVTKLTLVRLEHRIIKGAR